MSISEAFSSVLSKPVDFSGRARRSEYWWWLLCVSVIATVIAALAYQVTVVLWVVWFFFLLLVIVPSLAVTWRRLHDTGRSGAWYFIASGAGRRQHHPAGLHVVGQPARPEPVRPEPEGSTGRRRRSPDASVLGPIRVSVS